MQQLDKPRHRSVSQVESFSVNCPYAYKLRRIDRVHPLPSAWSWAGTCVHAAVLDDGNGRGWEATGRQATIRECQNVFLELYDQYTEEAMEKEPDLSRWLRPGNMKTETDIAKRRELGLRYVEEYINYAANDGLVPVVINGRPAVELEFTWNTGPGEFGEDVTVNGVVDLVLQDHYGQYLVRDLKTGKRPHWDFQLWVYGLALTETFGLEVEWGDYYLCKEGHPTAPIWLLEHSRETVVGLIHSMDMAQRRGYYNPRPGDHCWSCDVKHRCQFFG